MDGAAFELHHKILDLNAHFNVRITAKRGGAVLDVDRLDVSRAAERERYQKRLAERFNIAEEQIEAELQRILGMVEAEAERRDKAGEADQTKRGAGQVLCLSQPEPWPEPVTLQEALEETLATIRRFVVLPEEAARTVALWVAWTHVWEAGDICPILLITAPERRCGKTRLLEVLQSLVPRGLATSNITPSALFRTIELHRPVLLIDEADAFLKNNEDLRCLLNAGHTRASAFVLRSVPVRDDFEVRRFDVFCPKALAMIGTPATTIVDRSVVVRLARKRRDERVARLTRKALEELGSLARRLARATASDEVRHAVSEDDPEIPESLNDREADNWRPLLALADLAGGDWPAAARQAAVALCESDSESESAALRLIRDCLRVMGDRDRIGSQELANALAGLPDAPWGRWSGGKRITTHAIARLLRTFGIRPEHGRDGSTYAKKDFLEVASRYLPEFQASNCHNCHTEHNSFCDRELQRDTSKNPNTLPPPECHAVSGDTNDTYGVGDSCDTLKAAFGGGQTNLPCESAAATAGNNRKDAVDNALGRSSIAREISAPPQEAAQAPAEKPTAKPAEQDRSAAEGNVQEIPPEGLFLGSGEDAEGGHLRAPKGPCREGKVNAN